MKKTNPEISMTNSLGSEMKSLGINIAELSIDAVLDQDLLKDIPVVSSIVSLYKVGTSVRERRYLKNLIIFLNEFNKIDKITRQNYINSNLKSESDREKFGETILYLVEKADDFNKPELYARIFELHFNGHCTYDDAIRVCKLIDRSFYTDLCALVSFVDGSINKDLVTDELYKNGFLTFGSNNPKLFITAGGGLPYKKNKYAQLVVKVLKIV